jgi:predicted MFS family arabinose efflux permease
MNTGIQALIKDRPFLLLWGAQLVSQLADKIFLTLQVTLLTQYGLLNLQLGSWQWRLPEAERLLALLITATIPAVLLGSAAGIYVDRHTKRNVLIHCNLWRGVMLLVLPFLPKAFGILLVVVLLESILTQFFAPAEQSAIPLVVRPENLVMANSLFATTMISSIVVGNAIGAPIFQLVEQFGLPAGKEITVGGLYIVASLLMMQLPLKEERPANNANRLHPWSDFKAGLKYLSQNPLVSNAMVQLTAMYAVFAAITVLAIELTQFVGLRTEQFGFLIAAAGIGMILGAGLLNALSHQLERKPLPLIGFLIVAFVLLVFSMVKNLALALALSGLLGLGSVLIVVPMQTLIQQKTPESMRGKVFGFQNNVINIAITLPLVLTEVFTKQYGLTPVLAVMSLMVAGTGLWTWRINRRAMQNAT